MKYRFVKKGRIWAILVLALEPAFAARIPEGALALHEGWSIQRSAIVPESGAVLSQAGHKPAGWYPATVPTTVLAALVADGVYPDPYFGMNLRQISGTSYPVGSNYSNIPMPPESVFRSSWWYRTRFSVPSSYDGKRLQLHFDGLNFRANIWLNGRRIADSQQIAGSWRLFELDVTNAIRPGVPNALAVEVFPPTPEDLAITFVDWNPAPPDKSMGIWRDVYLTATGPVSLQFPQVITTLDLPSLVSAQLTVSVQAHNWEKQATEGEVEAQVGDFHIGQHVTLAAGEVQTVLFTPDRFAQLTLRHPKIWWPAGLGAQNLYDLKVRFTSDGHASSQASMRFGIRQVSSKVLTAEQPPQAGTSDVSGKNSTTESHRLFQINGKNILIRGAGYTFDMLLRESVERDRQELQYVRDMNLNTVRLEGKLVDEDFLQLADEYGILITAGWSCCDHWEQWKDWDEEDRRIAVGSLEDQVRRLRGHAAVFNWMNGSDNPPPPEIEKMYVSVLDRLKWPNPYESSATERSTSVTGATGVKMSGPYDYVPPSYWLLDTTLGGAHGFNTETSPGPAVPPADSLRSMLPAERLWPLNSWWDYHAGGGVFRNINTFTSALDGRYGPAKSVEDYALTAQVMEYEGERAMFEAYGRNKYGATGVIQWMLNNAWPSVIWHLYDYYLRPGGGYYGTKKACERLHVQYSYDDESIVVVNSFYQPFENLAVSAEVFTLDAKKKYEHATKVRVDADGVVKAFKLPAIDGLSSTYFVRLKLMDSSGKELSSNFYWLSTHPDKYNWKGSTWYYTPTTQYADLQSLRSLPLTKLKVQSKFERSGKQETTSVTVSNASDHVAFFVHVKVLRPAPDPEREGEEHLQEVLPVLWQDNYLSLLPGESRQVAAEYAVRDDAEQTAPTVTVDGWNIIPDTVTPTRVEGASALGGIGH